MIILVEFTCYFFPNITRENGSTDFGQAIMIYPMAHIKCHKSSLCGSLRSPPEGTITGVLTGSFGLHFPWPRAWDWSPAQVSVIITDYLASAFLTLVAKSCFAIANISERFPVSDYLCITWTVYSLLIVCCLPYWPRLPFGYSLCLPPAPTYCFDTVYESALPTLILILLYELCLSDLVFV